MSQKVLEVFAQKNNFQKVKEIVDEYPDIDSYLSDCGNFFLLKILISSDYVETLVDQIESCFDDKEKYRILVFPVEASIPRQKNENDLISGKQEKNGNNRVSREELYAKLSESANISKEYAFLVVLASLVAALGVLYENVAVIIGAMVIAPLLGSVMAFSLSTVLADGDLMKKSMKTIVVSFFLAILASATVGWFFEIDPLAPEIFLRTQIGLADLAIALASGVAGALSLTSRSFMSSVMGVMIAVALIPPLVVFGMLLGAGFLGQSLLAFLLLFANLVCINLSGVVTFVAQGIRPRLWSEAISAKAISFLIIASLVLLLISIVVVILLLGGLNLLI